jgi:hypothetical protein
MTRRRAGILVTTGGTLVVGGGAIEMPSGLH